MASPSEPASPSASGATAPVTGGSVASAQPPVRKSASAAGSVALPAAVDFDPLTLDPKQNARLRVDRQKLPPEMDLALVMDGKLLLRKSVGEFARQKDDVYLPPGVHEFRVRTGSGSGLKLSNTVSTDFEAKKRKTLRIELRGTATDPGKPAPDVTQAASLFVSLR